MGLDEELENIEDGAETEAEQIDEETELEDLEEFQDDEEFDLSLIHICPAALRAAGVPAVERTFPCS